jgi:nitroreductase
MQFQDLIKQRRSVRAYRPDPVEDEKLQQVLEAARLAPSAANYQPFQLIVVHTAGREEALKDLYQREWILQAPILILACGDPGQAWMNPNGSSYLLVDVAIAVDHLTLAAAELGLGTCWIASFDPVVAREAFQLPRDIESLILVPLGYPADEPQPKERKPLRELVRYEHW